MEVHLALQNLQVFGDILREELLQVAVVPHNQTGPADTTTTTMWRCRCFLCLQEPQIPGGGGGGGEGRISYAGRVKNTLQVQGAEYPAEEAADLSRGSYSEHLESRQ